jgi:hypothetical protein
MKSLTTDHLSPISRTAELQLYSHTSSWLGVELVNPKRIFALNITGIHYFVNSSHITLHSLEPNLVKMTVGCEMSYK